MSGRPTYALLIVAGAPLPAGVKKLARKRAAEMLERGKHAPLLDLLAAVYLLGVEDASDALGRES